MCNWESQPLPGVLEDLPPLPMSLPWPETDRLIEQLQQLRNVTVPDWLDSTPSPIELNTLFIVLDTAGMLVDSLRRQTVHRMNVR